MCLLIFSASNLIEKTVAFTLAVKKYPTKHLQIYFLRYLHANFKKKIMEDRKEKVCLFCKQDENAVPLVQVDYKGHNYFICPQHIPVLIHDPSQLEGMLPGADELKAG